MEVHHHTHTPDSHRGKNWAHYFWEFFMLFLAVTAGFLVENQREHYVEHRREKQYMRSMIEDLKLDTAAITGRIFLLDSILLPVLRQSTQILYLESYPDSILKKMYSVVPQSYRFLSMDFQDRTLMQLKNSGNFRLIRNKEVTDSLAAYWRICGLLNNPLLPGYEDSRIIVKEMVFSIFNLNYFKATIRLLSYEMMYLLRFYQTTDYNSLNWQILFPILTSRHQARSDKDLQKRIKVQLT